MEKFRKNLKFSARLNSTPKLFEKMYSGAKKRSKKEASLLTNASSNPALIFKISCSALLFYAKAAQVKTVTITIIASTFLSLISYERDCRHN